MGEGCIDARADPITRTIRCGGCGTYNRLAVRDGGVVLSTNLSARSLEIG
jgi:hypothetical protein